MMYDSGGDASILTQAEFHKQSAVVFGSSVGASYAGQGIGRLGGGPVFNAAASYGVGVGTAAANQMVLTGRGLRGEDWERFLKDQAISSTISFGASLVGREIRTGLNGGGGGELSTAHDKGERPAQQGVDADWDHAGGGVGGALPESNGRYVVHLPDGGTIEAGSMGQVFGIMRGKSIVADDSGNALYKNMAVHTEENLFQPVTSEPFKVAREVGAIFYRFTGNADFTRSIRTIHVDLVYGEYFSGTVGIEVEKYLRDPGKNIVGVAHTHPLDQGDWIEVGPDLAARALDTSVPSVSDARFDKRIDNMAGRNIRSWLVTTTSVFEYQGY